jgi:hypothetical protein
MKQRIPILNYWDKITEYYYANPDIQDSGHSIWNWLRKEYGAKRLRSSLTMIDAYYKNDLLEFEKDEDVTLFLVRWS